MYYSKEQQQYANKLFGLDAVMYVKYLFESLHFTCDIPVRGSDLIIFKKSDNKPVRLEIKNIMNIPDGQELKDLRFQINKYNRRIKNHFYVFCLQWNPVYFVPADEIKQLLEGNKSKRAKISPAKLNQLSWSFERFMSVFY